MRRFYNYEQLDQYNYFYMSITIIHFTGILEVTRSLLDSDHGEEALLESYTRNLHAIGRDDGDGDGDHDHDECSAG